MLLCLKALFHLLQESPCKLAVIISIESQYYKFYLNPMQALVVSLKVGFAMSGKEALMPDNFTHQVVFTGFLPLSVALLWEPPCSMSCMRYIPRDKHRFIIVSGIQATTLRLTTVYRQTTLHCANWEFVTLVPDIRHERLRDEI